jgi:hypothetical protein
MPTSRHERALRRAGFQAVAGVDEAGRGALFGPVFAAAVVLDAERPIRGLDDSKQLDPERREVLAGRIRERASAWAVGAADAFEIDHWNILEASRIAMKRAVDRISGRCDHLLIDAIRIPVALPQTPLIHGDALSFEFFDRRSIHTHQSGTRSRLDALGSSISPLRPSQQQRLRHSRSSGWAGTLRPDHPPPIQF